MTFSAWRRRRGIIKKLRRLRREKLKRDNKPNKLPIPKVNDDSGDFKVEIHSIGKASEEERAVFKRACEWLEAEINDEEFWDDACSIWRYTSHRWFKKDGKKQEIDFDDWKQYVLSGADIFNETPDGDLDLFVTLYHSPKRVIGYTYPWTWWTWFNRRFFKSFDVADIAGNIFHEYLHNLGMDHPNTDRSSVVYEMGYLVRDRIRDKIRFG